MALHVLSGARGGAGRAINAFSVSVGFQSSSWWLAGVSEHASKTPDTAYVPDRDVLVKGTCVLEHICHVSDTRDIPTPNILVKYSCATAFDLIPSGDVRDKICVCVCAYVNVRMRSEYIT